MHALRGLGVVAALTVGLTGCWASAQPEAHGPPPAAVVLDGARMETIEQWREVTGQLRALKRSLLASQEEGLVVTLGFEEGDQVRAGDVIAGLHDVRAGLAVARAQADVADRKAIVAEHTAEVQTARRDLDRFEQASGQATVAAMELDRMRSTFDVASARLDAAGAALEAAESDLRLARQRLEDMTIRAPFDGRLVSRRTQVGQWIGQGDAVVEIVALDTIEAWIDVPERYIERLSGEGGAVHIRCDAVGRTIEAAVTAVIPDADPLSKLFPVRVRLENEDLVLKPGMSVVGLVPTGSTAPTLTISKDAVLRDDAGEFVYFNGGGVAAVARITTLFGLAGNRLAIRSDSLPPGAGVVVEGNERLFPGQPLAIQGGAGAPADAPSGAPTTDESDDADEKGT
jgi:RND family efflux transporter MFP subunit